MQVQFTAAYSHPSADRQTEISYRKGWSGTVTKEIGEAAIAAGVANAVVDGEPVGPRGGKARAVEAEPRLPGNLDPALAEPDALTPNRHVADGDESK